MISAMKKTPKKTQAEPGCFSRPFVLEADVVKDRFCWPLESWSQLRYFEEHAQAVGRGSGAVGLGGETGVFFCLRWFVCFVCFFVKLFFCF